MLRTGKISLVVGMLIGLVVGTICGNFLRTPTAEAQEPAKAQTGNRYQLKAWACGGNYRDWGAYIIDQQSGQVFYIEKNSKPQLLGSVAK
jgi:hypothetical protein